MARRRIMKEFRIDEISGVDRPAQAGARAVLMKRADDSPVRKDGAHVALVTSAVDGHSHLLWLYGERAGETGYGVAEGDDPGGHSHPWTMDAMGGLVIHENHGHTHEVQRDDIARAVASMLKTQTGDHEMDHKEQVEKLTADNAALQKRLEIAEKRAELTDAERSYLKGLSESEAEAFLKRDAQERAALVETARRAALERNPVVFKSVTGEEYRQNDDPRLVQMARDRDADRERIEKAEAAAERTRLEKRVGEELANLPGDLDTRVALLESVEKIADEKVRAEALKAIKAGNDALKGAFSSLGTSSSGTSLGDLSVDDQLDELAKARAAKDGITFEKAYALVLGSDEGRALYAKRRAS